MRNPFDSDERRDFRETVERFVRERIEPHAGDWDEAGAVPDALHEEIGALGVFGFGVDAEYGGLGFDDPFMRSAFNRAMGYTGATGVAAQIGARTISTGPIHALGSHALKMELLPDIVAGRRGASLAITEPGGGSDVAAIRTRAVRDGDHYRLTGEKTFITGAIYASVIVVAARTGGPGMSGLSMFAVDADSPGLARTPLERKMGWWAADQATLTFDDCLVPAERLLGDENRGFLSVVDNFNLERVALIGQALGMMQRCLDESVNWARERQTFGQALIAHQAIRHKLAEMSARIDMAESYLNQICWLIETGPMPVAEIAKAKFSTTKALEYCASEAMQVLGGAGYLRGQPVERIYREVKVLAIGGGSEEIMRDLAARQMGW